MSTLFWHAGASEDHGIVFAEIFDETGTPQSGRTKASMMPSVRPTLPLLDFSLLRYFQRIIDLDPKISNRAFQLGMTEQELDGP